MVDKYGNNCLNDQVIQSVRDYVKKCASFKYWCDLHYQWYLSKVNPAFVTYAYIFFILLYFVMPCTCANEDIIN